jgi:hypothetical protein
MGANEIMPKKKSPESQPKGRKTATSQQKMEKVVRKKGATPKVAAKADAPKKATVKKVSTEKRSTKKTSPKKTTATEAVIKKDTLGKATKSIKPRKLSKSEYRAVVESADKRMMDHLAKTYDMSARVLPLAPEAAYERAVVALRNEEGNLRSRPGFIFADVGYKFVNGRRTDQIAVRLHVDKKSKGLGCIGSSCFNNTVPTDVLVTRFTKASGTTDAGDQIQSDSTNGSGTLGMGVKVFGGVLAFMTCAHVVSDEQPPASERSVLFDSNGQEIAVSTNYNRSLYQYNEAFDLALVIPTLAIEDDQLGRFVENEPGVVPPNRIVDVSSSDRERPVYKFGAKTGFSKGFIDSVEQLPVPIDELDVTDHIIVRSAPSDGGSYRPFADKGDSGAIVVTEDGGVIGMVRGVSIDRNRERTIVTKMTRIMYEFRIETTFTS